MSNFITTFFNRRNVGDRLAALKVAAEHTYYDALGRVEAEYREDIAEMRDLAEEELAALEHAVDTARDRIASLLSVGIHLGSRQHDADALHARLTTNGADAPAKAA